MNFLPPYLKEKYIGCGFGKKELGEVFMQHDGKLETCPFR